MDHLTKEQRSLNMSKVKSKHTKPEMKVRKLLHSMGYRFRLHRKDLHGKPDIVLPKYKTVIFVHGCFWHRHSGCKRASTPKTNIEFWERKFLKNIENDKNAYQALSDLGWKVIVIWECEVSDMAALKEKILDIL